MRARHLNARRRQRGITLVEVLVAVTVLAIALVAIFGAIDVQIRNTAALADRMFAHWVALNSMEEARLTGAVADRDAEATTELGGVVWTVTIRREPAPYGLTRVEVAATAEGRPGAMLVGFLPSEAPQ